MQNAVMTSDTSLKEIEEIEELSGKLGPQDEEDKLMRSVMENDKQTIEDGKLINECMNKGIGAFSPDLMFEQLVTNYSMAKDLYGKTIIKSMTSYDPGYVEKNRKFPEFQKELKKKINDNVEKLRENGILDDDNSVTEKGIKIASLTIFNEELDSLNAKGILGEKIHKKDFIYGDKEGTKTYKKGDRYRDLALKKSIKLAIRRNKKQLSKAELKTFERQSKGQIHVIYALDSSGSMKGGKVNACKKAGIALAYKAIDKKDKTGLIIFGSKVREEIAPCLDFPLLLDTITRIKYAREETDLQKAIMKSIELFPNKDITKHLLLITDAMPTKGEDPEKETLEAVSLARNNNITISLVGIQLDKKAKKLAEKITQIGNGKLYVIRDIENIDKIVLEDYYGVI